ncbi:MAG: oxygen-independent coproporphyrinogen III oxidase [bacterium]
MNLQERLQPLLEKYDGAGPRYTSYPPIPYWGEVDGDTVAGWLAQPAADENTVGGWLAQPLGDPMVDKDTADENPAEGGTASSPLSLYTHIPFCRSRCHYCGCFVIITPHQKPASDYLRAVHQEMEMVAERLPGTAPVRQYHLGGGTPNFITLDEMAALVDKARSLFPFQDDMEMSLEVDPRHLGKGEVEALAGIGFNRISLGVQDFDEKVQAGVNRSLPFGHVAGLMEALQGAGFEGINFDLIYGLPHQTAAGFERTMERVLELRPHRLALYNFAYLPNAFPHQRKLDAAALPERDEKLAIFLAAQRVLTENGYVTIGMDHFALEDDELARAYRGGTMRRNFMGYTTQAETDLLAFGVSGISEYDGRFWQNEKNLARYRRVVASGTLPAVRGMALEPEDRLRKHLIAGLFCQGALDFNALEDRFAGVLAGQSMRDHLAEPLRLLAPLSEDGLVETTSEGLRVTGLGRFFLRNIAMVFDRHLLAGNKPPAQFSRTV